MHPNAPLCVYGSEKSNTCQILAQTRKPLFSWPYLPSVQSDQTTVSTRTSLRNLWHIFCRWVLLSIAVQTVNFVGIVFFCSLSCRTSHKNDFDRNILFIFVKNFACINVKHSQTFLLVKIQFHCFKMLIGKILILLIFVIPDFYCNLQWMRNSGRSEKIFN